jgi:biotin transporter BioY
MFRSVLVLGFGRAGKMPAVATPKQLLEPAHGIPPFSKGLFEGLLVPVFSHGPGGRTYFTGPTSLG